MAAVKFLSAAVCVGVLAGLAVVALAPARQIPTTARAAVKPVPPLAGETLGDAQARLDEQGIPYETIGGGLFGIWIDSNWTVCESHPAGPSFVEPGEDVMLLVDRACV